MIQTAKDKLRQLILANIAMNLWYSTQTTGNFVISLGTVSVWRRILADGVSC
jgi:hypothetical protein